MKQRLSLFAIVFALGAVLLAGCGEKADYSGSNELSKPADPAAVPHPTAAGAPTASPAEFMQKRTRPDGH